MVELADTGDLKSPSRQENEGSTPSGSIILLGKIKEEIEKIFPDKYFKINPVIKGLLINLEWHINSLIQAVKEKESGEWDRREKEIDEMIRNYKRRSAGSILPPKGESRIETRKFSELF